MGRPTKETEVVRRCVPRQDGGWMVVTAKGSGSSPIEIPEGARVIIRDGQAVRTGYGSLD